MNYIPGFSNYLEASVPEYGPAPIMDAEPVVPQRAAVEPTTQEAVAPYTLSGLSPEALAGLYALSANNAGSSGIAGLPSLGAGYTPQFEERLITAPVSNKGNPTAYSGMDNQFYMSPNDFVRLVDRSTNSVVFEGTGYEAAQKAVEMGQNLTDTMGRKANYQIQTGKTQDSYVPVANEKFNKTDLQNIAGAVGTALPLAMAFVPGLNLGVLGSIGAGAGVGGASAALKGENILKGAAIGGLSAAGGQVLGPALEAGGGLGTALAPRLATAVGTGLGSTAGGLVTGQNLKDALIGGVVSGGVSYLAPDITKELGIGQGANTSNTSGGGGAVDPNVMATVTGYTAPSISVPFSGAPSGTQQPAPPKVQDPYDGLNVIGNKFGNLAGVDVGNVFGAPTGPTSAFDQMFRAEQPAEETPTEDEILVQARKAFNPVSITSPLATDFLPKNVFGEPTPADTASLEEILVEARKPPTPSVPVTPLSPELLRAIEGPQDQIVVTGNRPGAVPSVTIPGIDTPLPDMTQPAEADKKKLGLEEYLRLAGLASGLLGNIGGGGGAGAGQTGTYGGGGTGRLNPIFSAKLPSAGGLGTIGANRTLRPMGDVDWLTYGTRPELNFYDYAARSNPAPVTTPIPNNPAGPIMEERDPMAMAKGGRTEFAVSGAGTGRSDDIPAVLSDGEYVIDAETVALLGDGSSKAGAKKLDDLRVKVRKHKGQKLAKGRFSANAKRPEAYLSGGRI